MYEIQKPQNPIDEWDILIIDDEPDNSAVARRALEYHGATVHIAMSGKEGLALLETLRPTVILLDIRMSVLDGWQVFELIRKLPDHATVPIIAVTAYAMKEDRDKALRLGFDGYIVKPFDVFIFAQEVERLTTQALENQQAKQ